MGIRDLFRLLLDVTMTDMVDVRLHGELELKRLEWGDLLKDEYSEYYVVFGYMTESNTLILNEV